MRTATPRFLTAANSRGFVSRVCFVKSGIGADARQNQAESFARPFDLRRDTTFLPALVFILCLKPCLFFLFLLLG